MNYDFKIKSITGQIHDTGSAPGCLPYKIVVIIELPVKVYNKLCPIVGAARNTLYGRQPARRSLGSLVVNVNNAVYDFNKNIKAHNPSIDSQGERRAKNGIKTLEFVYFMSKQDWAAAEALGFEHHKFKNGEVYAKAFQQVSLYREAV